MATIDQKKCFYHMKVNTVHRMYLGFHFEGQYYVWNVLSFGLSVSPYFCNKIIRPVVAYVDTLQLRTTMCNVDDWILFRKPETFADELDSLKDTVSYGSA